MTASAITTEGVHCDVVMSDYQASPALSRSKLLDFRKSPAFYWAKHRDPLRNRLRAQPKETAGQRVGNLAHAMILEPGAFFDRHVVVADMNRNRKDWHEIEEAAARAGKMAVQQSDYDLAELQAERVHELPEVGDMLEAGDAEVSIVASDPERDGLQLRIRPDFVHWLDAERRSCVVLDVKTLGDATPAGIATQIGRQLYHLQEAFYRHVLGLLGIRVQAFVFVGVEAEPPCFAGSAMLDNESRTVADLEIADLLNRFADCEARGVWPGQDSVDVVRLPRYLLPARY